MSDIKILHEMIKNSAKIGVIKEKAEDKNHVILTEAEGSAHPEYSVTISGMPDNAIVIKADAFTAPKSIFNDSKQECKRADFVIITDSSSKKKIILCIEMKTSKGETEKEIIQQLKGAQCFVAYCKEIGKSFWDKKDFLDGYIYRFVSIKNISISKKQTRTKKHKGIHDRPENMLKISSPHRLQFNHLVGAR